MDPDADLLRREVLDYFGSRQRYDCDYEKLFCELILRKNGDAAAGPGAHVIRERIGNGREEGRDPVAENTFVLVLRGESVANISRLCRCAPNTVRRRYWKAKAELTRRFPWVKTVAPKSAGSKR